MILQNKQAFLTTTFSGLFIFNSNEELYDTQYLFNLNILSGKQNGGRNGNYSLYGKAQFYESMG